MNTVQAASCCQSASSSTPPTGLGRYLPSWLRGRRGIILGVVAVGGGGMALQWPWLVAIGVAPVLLSLLPCAVMCGLGLCMMGKKGQSGPSQASQAITGGDVAAPKLLAMDAPQLTSGQLASQREPAILS